LKAKVSKIKFGDYAESNQIEIKTLEDQFSSHFNPVYEHTEYKDYFQLLWEFITQLTYGKHCFEDILAIFEQFQELTDLKDNKVKSFENPKLTEMLKTYLRMFSNFDAKVLTQSEEMKTTFMR
jgi:hypothetical protein